MQDLNVTLVFAAARSSSGVWLPDGSGFVYSRVEPERLRERPTHRVRGV
jgi:hypothetical protein